MCRHVIPAQQVQQRCFGHIFSSAYSHGCRVHLFSIVSAVCMWPPGAVAYHQAPLPCAQWRSEYNLLQWTSITSTNWHPSSSMRQACFHAAGGSCMVLRSLCILFVVHRWWHLWLQHDQSGGARIQSFVFAIIWMLVVCELQKRQVQAD